MQRTFETAGPATLDLRVPAGEIQIDATSEGRVEVELIAHDEESRALVEVARVEQQGERILVDVPYRRSGFSFQLLFGRQGITCRVKCPPSSNVEVRSKSADVRSRGALGAVVVTTAAGDVDLDIVERNLFVKNASGDVHADRVGGDVNASTASGDVALGVVGGTSTVQAVSGDVRIGEASGDATVKTVSGDQQHDGVFTGSVFAQSVSGDVVVAVRRGAKVYLDCNTLSGDTSSDLDMTGEPDGDASLIEIRVKTVSGDIRITRASAPADSAQEVHA
jgi:Putative adhesin